MKTLNGLELHRSHISRTLPWNHINPIIHHKPKITNGNHRVRTYWRLNAEAKGFNRAPAKAEDAAKESKIRRKNEAGEGDEIPEVVQKRIISRILSFVGVPLAVGIVLLKGLGAAKQQSWWDVPYWLPVLTTLLTFGASTLGIAYGALSSSWDANREGSLFGFEEAEKNWVEIWKEEDDA
ncbi:OLC1v1027501C1 [Oldenlandia corymbosa var. corymbosa]|uniref:OLC1v1027501C1 n=1 Tax=Oldenlandia corymbosa var. corymbosa TaxID=529605 RepID=A0AAV1CA80_OLDCO|nr:OLC1v1027501C1 [Oldenlandia corymbosa var. corymbosa]